MENLQLGGNFFSGQLPAAWAGMSALKIIFMQ
jgi:hypothetical protein